jgi:hypothetical protein
MRAGLAELLGDLTGDPAPESDPANGTGQTTL